MTKSKISMSKLIWCKIRYYQQLHDLTNERLATIFNVKERTLREYDKKAENITLAQIDRFLEYAGVNLSELITV